MDEDTAGVLDERGLARMTSVPVREIWPNEAHDFTPWVAEHLELLAEALGVESLELVDVEVRVGDFSLDVLAKDANDDYVVIENQLERSDHNHLGQLLAYAAGLDAAMVVWVAPSFRDEHLSTLSWLNEYIADSIGFFAVEVDLIKIGDSSPAPRLDLVTKPNSWDQQVQERAGVEPSELNQQRRDFYLLAFERCAELIPGFKVPKPQAQNWNSFRSGPFGNFAFVFDKDGRFRVEIYLDNVDEQVPTALFDTFYAKREEYEPLIGHELTWERLDDRRACRISLYRDPPDLADEQDRDQCALWCAQRTKELVDAFESDLRSEAKLLLAGA